MDHTTNLGLNKPSQMDYFNVEHLNQNAEIIDTAYGEMSDDINTINENIGTMSDDIDTINGNITDMSGDITDLDNDLQTKWGSLFNLIYPVGSIYFSTANVNPSTLFGGTWEAFGTADTYLRLGGTGSGGSNAVTLSADQIPSLTTGKQSANHTHTGTTGNQSANHAHTVNGGSHSHSITVNTSGDIIFTKSGKVTSGGGSTVPMDWGGGLKTNSEGGHTHTVGNNNANHTHTMTTGNQSADHTHTYTNNDQQNVSITPKYVQTYAWKRTA